jgi:hypothetical protein
MAAPGITLNEIDSTGGTTEVQPTGRSAGVIGTALQGTAFVPVTVANVAQLRAEFGYGDSLHVAPIALQQWLQNASAGTYVRVLGAGDGKKRTATGANAGKVNNAGFVVGSRLVRSETGALGNNSYATTYGLEGRTYFLGCYMSESAGSWAFSETGIQNSTASQPIIRGVLFAASGVQIALSSSAPGATSDTYSATKATEFPAKGWFTGSLDLRSGKQDFTVFLNGHNNSGYGSIITASFIPSANNYISRAFNTDPDLLEEYGHVLYAHYDVLASYAVPTGSGVAPESLIRRNGTSIALEEIVFCLTGSQARNDGTTVYPNYEGFEDRYTAPSTPYIASQDFGGTRYDLFKVHARSDGEQANELFKVEIRDIKYPTVADGYATFTLLLRSWEDTDDSRTILEEYPLCNLDPDSSNYIAKLVGDQNVYFDFDRAVGSQKIVEEGLYGRVSRRIRVQVSDAVANKIVPTNTLPIATRGYYHLVTSGSGFLSTGGGTSYLDVPLTNARELPVPFRRTIHILAETGSASAIPEPKYCWGPQFDIPNSLTRPNDGTSDLNNTSMASYTKYFPKYHTVYQNPWVGDNAGAATVDNSVVDADLFNKNLFTLENVQVQTGSNGRIDNGLWRKAVYQRDGILDNSLGGRFVNPVTDFVSTLGATTYLKHVTFMQGGFDGLNKFDPDKFYMRDSAVRREMDNANQGELDGPTVAAYRKAVDIMGDKSFADVHLLAIPDVRHPAVTDYALSAMQTKFDAMYLMDVELKDENNSFVTSSIDLRANSRVNVGYTATRFSNRSLNSSFGAAYFPDVKLSIDPGTGIAEEMNIPATAAALGAFSQNDALGFAWTAPAGYNRSRIPATGLTTIINQTNIDTVYDAGVNPLTRDADGVTIIGGQRTLLREGSALDRVNVRRLLIEVRRRVRAVAYGFLFEPNRAATIARFNAAVAPIMRQVQAQRGVDRYRVQIDTSTTTQADVENNTIRGKIFLQPTRAAEFISITFEASNSI